MTDCVFEYQTERVSIRSFGKAIEYNPKDILLADAFSTIATLVRDSHAKVDLPKRVIWQRLPGSAHAGSRKVTMLNDETVADKRGWVEMNSIFIRADATVIDTPGIGVVKTSRDCPYLVLWSECEGPVIVLHCGRDQLHNVNEGKVTDSVIKNVLEYMSHREINPESIRGVITMGIKAEHFQNDRYPKITSALKHAWGTEVVPDKERHTIDLRELILRQLEAGGISRENVVHDGLDTYTDSRLASLRRGPAGHQTHNMVLVTRKS